MMPTDIEPRLASGIDAGGPYRAEAIGPHGSWIVVNKVGVNVGVFTADGATLAQQHEAQAAADSFNAEHELLVSDYDDEDDDAGVCSRCHGDGMDPWCDYCMPCPMCLGESRL